MGEISEDDVISHHPNGLAHGNDDFHEERYS